MRLADEIDEIVRAVEGFRDEMLEIQERFGNIPDEIKCGLGRDILSVFSSQAEDTARNLDNYLFALGGMRRVAIHTEAAVDAMKKRG